MAQAVASYNYPEELIYEEEMSYDIEGSAVPQREYDQPKTQTDTKQHRRAKARAEARTQTVYGISLTAIFGFVAVVLLLITVLLAHISYTELADSVVTLQTQLDDLNDAEKKLKIQYEEAFDINAIEQYAEGTLNMSKPSDDQIASSRAVSENKAEVITEDSQNEGVFTQLAEFISSLMGYFK
jgi:cell division protein FtsL